MASGLIHPGEHLVEALEELGVPSNRITPIPNGTRAVTADTALRLGHWFGTGADLWLNLQKLYELRVADAEIGAEIKKLPKRKAA